MQCCPRCSRQHCKRKNSLQFCLNTLETTLHRSRPYTMQSEMLQTTFHKKKIPCNVFLILLGQHCTGQNAMQCCRRCSTQRCIRKNSLQCCLYTLATTLHRSRPYRMQSKMFQTTFHKKNILYNVFLILMGQHSIAQNPIQCCPRCSRQNCIRENLVECRLNTLGTTLHRSKLYAMLFEMSQTKLYKKKSCSKLT